MVKLSSERKLILIKEKSKIIQERGDGLLLGIKEDHLLWKKLCGKKLVDGICKPKVKI